MIPEGQDVVSELTELFHDVARRTKRDGGTEEDVKLGIEPRLREACAALGIEVDPKYEKTLISGPVDALYGHAILEYEAPGKISTKGGYKETVGQLQDYLMQYAYSLNKKAPYDELERMVGISLDGSHFVFCQYRGLKVGDGIEFLPGQQVLPLGDDGLTKQFGVRDVPVTEESVSYLLSVLRSMSRPPLTAQGLAEQFGPDGEVARSLVPVFYEYLSDSPTKRTEMFLEEWKRLFGIVYGESFGTSGAVSEELAKLYNVKDSNLDFPRLLFSVQTYFALVMKLIAVQVLTLQQGALLDRYIHRLSTAGARELKRSLIDLESGELFSHYGVKNFLEGDFFQWYLYEWSSEIQNGIQSLARELDKYEPSNALIHPEQAEDLLTSLYQRLIPRKLRHKLGEYYTPEWLAEHLVDQLGFAGTLEERALDPACGSGTFLVALIRRVRLESLKKEIPLADVAAKILANIVGFDINPLAVIAARTNYLLALGDLVKYLPKAELPIYLCDSILTPERDPESHAQVLFGEEDLRSIYRYKASVADFPIPSEVLEKGLLAPFVDELEKALPRKLKPDTFREKVTSVLSLQEEATGPATEALYRIIRELDEQGIDGIWGRILKNSAAPLNVGEFDFVVGNPPWIQWEDLDPGYRVASEDLWKRYGLSWDQAKSRGLQSKGRGAVKKDLSMLFAYACSDRYLKEGGKLGFFITQTVFQSKAGSLFRQLETPDGTNYQIEFADDYVDLKPFDASNQSASFVWTKGPPMTYPLPYTLWQKGEGISTKEKNNATSITDIAAPIELLAEPSRNNKKKKNDSAASPWMIAPKGTHRVLRHLQVTDRTYQARAGVTTWLNGVYLLEIVEERPDGRIVVRNRVDQGKKQIPQVTRLVEKELLYPFVPQSGIGLWRVTTDEAILVPHRASDGGIIGLETMEEQYPLTFEYLCLFEEELRARAGYKLYFTPADPFYICDNVGPDWATKRKVAWPGMGKTIHSAVLEPVDFLGAKKTPIHIHTSSSVPIRSSNEAFYLSGMLNSMFPTSYALATTTRNSKGFGSTSLLDEVVAPEFNPDDPRHSRIAKVAKKIGQGNEEFWEELNELVGEVWDISDAARKKIGEIPDLFA